MADFPGATVISNVPNQGAGKTALEDFLAATKQLPGALPTTTLTISGDQITPTQSSHSIDTQGAAGTDDLKQILQGTLPNGSLLYLNVVSASRTVKVWNAAGGTGQITLKTGDNFWMGDPSHYLLLRRSGSTWEEIERFPRADMAPFLTKNANYTLSATNDRARALYSSGNDWTLTLPNSSAAGKGYETWLYNPSDGIVTIVTTGADFVDGKTSIKLHKGDSVHLMADGATLWLVMSRTKHRFGRGYLFGLTLANSGADATNDILIGPGECASDDSDDEVRVRLSIASTYTKQLDTAWATGGSTAGGRISGESLVDGTWHVYMFRRSDGISDICFSQSLTPTLPNSGTHKRRVGSIIRESGAIVAFIQDGNYFSRVIPILDLNLTNPGTAAASRTLSVPNGIEVFAFGNAVLTSPSIDAQVWFSDLAINDQTPSFTAQPLSHELATAAKSSPFDWQCRTNTSRQIRTRVDASNGGTVLRIATVGWLDQRGQTR